MSFLWYLLVGILITSVSYNSIVNSGCSINAAEMQKRHDEYESGVQAAHEASQKADDNRVYSTNE